MGFHQGLTLRSSHGPLAIRNVGREVSKAFERKRKPRRDVCAKSWRLPTNYYIRLNCLQFVSWLKGLTPRSSLNLAIVLLLPGQACG